MSRSVRIGLWSGLFGLFIIVLFGDRSVLIARSVSWSPDSQHIYAAVADVRTDVVLLHGLLT